MDLCLYQMGNNVRYHREIYAAALQNPGLVVLHDLNLYAFHDDLFVQSGRTAAYLREMGFAYGMRGSAAGLALLDDPGLRDDAHYPLLERIAQLSLGVLVHSEYARRYVGRRCPRAWVRHVNQPVTLPPTATQSSTDAKAQLGYSADDFLLASFGYAAWTKRIDRVLPVLAELRTSYPQLRYAVVGEVVEGYDVEAQAQALGLSDIVRFTGFVTGDQYMTYLAAADVGVNLRYPTTGETSAALLSLLAAGKPALVSNVDAFVELPQTACFKIDPDEHEADQLRDLLRRLLAEPALLAEMGQAAHAYIASSCGPVQVAQQYIDFAAAIVAAAGRPAVQATVSER